VLYLWLGARRPTAEHCGIEEEIANPELFKFMDNNTNSKNPKQKESPDHIKPF
jgi:hypothetical protein